MKVLVLGSSGQVGVELMRAAWPPGTGVAGLARPEVDLTEAASLEAALARFNPDVVVNAAAYTSVDKAESDRAQAFAVNASGPDMLAAACARRDTPLVHVSTDYVFDGSLSRSYKEDDAIGPINVYGMSKAAGEAAVRLRQPRHVILRTSWVYAAHGQNFVRTMLRLGGQRDKISVVADQYGTPTSAVDIAGAIVSVTQRLVDSTPNSTACGTFHFTADGHTSWYGFAEEIFRYYAEALGRAPQIEPIPTSAFPTAARRPANSRLNCTRIESVFQVQRSRWQDNLFPVVQTLLAGTNTGTATRSVATP